VESAQANAEHESRSTTDPAAESSGGGVATPTNSRPSGASGNNYYFFHNSYVASNSAIQTPTLNSGGSHHRGACSFFISIILQGDLIAHYSSYSLTLWINFWVTYVVRICDRNMNSRRCWLVMVSRGRNNHAVCFTIFEKCVHNGFSQPGLLKTTRWDLAYSVHSKAYWITDHDSTEHAKLLSYSASFHAPRHIRPLRSKPLRFKSCKIRNIYWNRMPNCQCCARYSWCVREVSIYGCYDTYLLPRTTWHESLVKVQRKVLFHIVAAVLHLFDIHVLRYRCKGNSRPSRQTVLTFQLAFLARLKLYTESFAYILAWICYHQWTDESLIL
jgi:hypothetical protein